MFSSYEIVSDAVDRSPSSPGSPDEHPGFPDEVYQVSDENEDTNYDELVESIRNLVIVSPCIDDLEDRGVPLEPYIHRFLEQVRNHRGASVQCLPIRSLPTQTCNPGTNEGSSRVSMGNGFEDNGGNKKRKNGENSGPGRGSRDTDSNDSNDDGSDGIQGGNPDNVKKQKTGKVDGLSCHFRKRNPTRFNVREHQSCALSSFQSIALLKSVVSHPGAFDSRQRD